MKKVVCVNAKNFGNPYFKGPSHQEGDVLTVAWEGYDQDIYSYEFVESGRTYRYSAWRYAPLDGQDETELVTEEFNEKYCVPVNN